MELFGIISKPGLGQYCGGCRLDYLTKGPCDSAGFPHHVLYILFLPLTLEQA